MPVGAMTSANSNCCDRSNPGCTSGRTDWLVNDYERKTTMKFNATLASALVLVFAIAGLAACEKGPAEKAGEKIDSAAKNVGEKMERAGDKVKDSVKK
jgi:hypothetical protein